MLRAWAISLFLLAAVAPADEIVRDGEAVHGTLVLNGGRLQLRGEDGKARAVGADLVTLNAKGKTFRDGPAHVVVLSKEERLTGVLVGMEKETIVLRTAWAERVAVRHAGVVSLSHLPGWRTVIREDFAGKSMRLTKVGQAVEVPVGAKLDAGRVGVLFQEGERATGSRWAVEAVFESHTVRVTLGGDTLRVDAGKLCGTEYLVKRSGDRRKLTLAFAPGSLRVACDDAALWHSPDGGPGALRRVRLVCVAIDPKEAGAFTASGVFVEAAEPVRRRPTGDPKRDELWLASGDQLFGDVKRVDPQGVEIAWRFGRRSYAWKELRGWFPRRSEVVAGKMPKGVEVRLEVHSGMRAEPDVLEGVLIALDAKKATLHHAVFGELVIPRTSIATMRIRDR